MNLLFHHFKTSGGMGRRTNKSTNFRLYDHVFSPLKSRDSVAAWRCTVMRLALWYSGHIVMLGNGQSTMKLRLKVLIILAGMWILVSMVTYLYSRSALIDEYTRLERTDLIADIERTRNTFNTILHSIYLLNADWAQWDDAYQFMIDKNNSFIRSNLSFTTFANSNINLILFFDAQGKLFYGADYDLRQKKFVPIPQELLNYLETASFTLLKTKQDSRLGMIRTPAGYVVLSAMPILRSTGAGPSHGTLVMGYFLTNEQIQKISQIINIEIQFYSFPILPANAELKRVYQYLEQGNKYFLSMDQKNIIYGYTFINDIDNKPIGILRITAARELFNEGLRTINRYLIIVIGMGVLFLISIWYLLKIFVLDRLISVSKQVIEINSESQFNTRIQVKGKDELGTMVAAINSLMEIIELTQEQLKYRIQLRTEELERLSKLNKNLYTEMTHQKETEVKLREGEKMLRQMAYYDTLTGLPNRLFFNELLQNTITQSARTNTSFAVFFIDADKFKSINDTYGHNIGDRFLKHTAIQLTHSIRESDIAARLAGDEFIIILNNISDVSHISREANKILKNVSVPFFIDNLDIKSTYSMGICLFPSDGTTVEELEKHADLAMYYAKKQMGNSYCYYHDIPKSDTQHLKT
jgi:diguanylate cyclase (GGDEF)-like protein